MITPADAALLRKYLRRYAKEWRHPADEHRLSEWEIGFARGLEKAGLMIVDLAEQGERDGNAS